MPFKIIETKEKGQNKLTIIPSLWESEGRVRWPRKKLNLKQLTKDEHSEPANDWSTYNCNVKRPLLSSYEEAVRELDLMVQNSDTEVDNATETIRTDKNMTDFNNLADQLVNSRPEKSIISSTATTSTMNSEETTAAEYVIQYVENSELPVDSHENELGTPLNTDANQIETYLKIILDNQNKLALLINGLEENQNKIFRKLANLTVQIDEGFSCCNQTKNNSVVTLGESHPTESEAFIIKPINSAKELQEMDLRLSDKSLKSKMLKQYSFVCSQSDGKGGTCAYKVLDLFFSREFLCKCSWTGGSRGSEEVKVGLKGFKNILNFYYELVRSWDRTYTNEENENFFKVVLKNAVKRKLSKNERASTKRRRTKKSASQKTNVRDDPSAGPSSKIGSDQINEENYQAETNLAGPSSKIESHQINHENNEAKTDLDEKNTTINDDSAEEESIC